MSSIILLYKQIPYLDQQMLEDAAAKAWQVEFESGDESTTFAAGATPAFMLRVQDRIYSIHHVDEPYFELPLGLDDEQIEYRTKCVIENHRGYISVELVEDDDLQYDPNSELARIGRLMSQWVNDDTLAVAFPQTEQIIPWDPSLEPMLAGFEPIANLGMPNSPVLSIADDNPDIIAAVDQARDQWPRFVAAFEANAQREQQGETPEKFSVKAPITIDGVTEFIWMTVTAIENQIVYGLLSNQPVSLAGLDLGDRVRVPIIRINDWLYSFRGQQHGGFTVKILNDLMR